MKKFLFGLAAALIVGFLYNTLVGYVKLGYFQHPEKIVGNVFRRGSPPSPGGLPADTNVKLCKELIPEATLFGSLTVTIVGNAKPLENLEVDVSTKPGPVRCMAKTDKNGVARFRDVPATRMVIYFNNADFPKEFGSLSPVPVEIIPGQTTEKIVDLARP